MSTKTSQVKKTPPKVAAKKKTDEVKEKPVKAEKKEPKPEKKEKVEKKQRTPVIVMAAPRVRDALCANSLNIKEYAALTELVAGENRPFNKEPQGPQVHLKNMSESTQTLVVNARKAFMDRLPDLYVMATKSKMTPVQRERYALEKKQAIKDKTYRAREFNENFDSKFYSGYTEFEKEKVAELDKVSEWRTAIGLISKSRYRLASTTRFVLACFLDRVVEQYAVNAVHNCVTEGKKKSLSVRYALEKTDGFEKRVTLSRFVDTLDTTALVRAWLTKDDKTKLELPSLNYKFDTYVRNITCQVTRDAKVDFNVSADFKDFLAHVCNEIIIRVGEVLKGCIGSGKTVTENMVYEAIRQIHAACGMDYVAVQSQIAKKMEEMLAERAKAKEAKEKKE